MKQISNYLNFNDFVSIIIENSKIEINSEVISRVEKSHDFLVDFSKNKIIYGVNTGFGPMAQYRIEEENTNQLQFNLIRSHATGAGQPLPIQFVKAAMLARLNSMSLGFSGVHPSVIHLIQEFLNRDITPVIFEHGSVGASGDLVQLSHLALSLIGEGEVWYKGARRFTKEVFEEEKLSPITISIREGLALMNGTSVMTGIGAVNVYQADRLVELMIKISAFINELVEAYDDHLSVELNRVKLHEGQQYVAESMRNVISDSKRIRKRAEHLYDGEHQEEVFKDKVQEYYSLRCLPQIIGPIYETVQKSKEVIERELNSANDNPIIDVENQNVFHGGNFHGDYVSIEMDKLKMAITKLTMLAERQLNYLLNSKINELLPPFVNLGKLGFNFGMQGAQFTATSTTAESQTLSFPMYVHSIPNNNDNQDIVSMGTNAAVLTSKVIENAFQVIAIELITLVQAVDYLEAKDGLSSVSRKMYDQIRELVPTFVADSPMYLNIEKVTNYLKGK